MASASVETDLAKIDWVSQIQADWPDIANNVTDQFKGLGIDIDASDVLSVAPLPSVNHLQEVALGINTVSGLLDGDISSADIANIKSVLQTALNFVISGTVLAGSALGSIAPGVGTAVGAGVGLLIDAVVGAFDNSKAERRAAILKAKDKTEAAVKSWERSVLEGSWMAYAGAQAPIVPPAPADNHIDAMLGRFATHRETPDDLRESASFRDQSRTMLTTMGFRPSGVSTGYGTYSGSEFSWAAAEAAWEKPFETRDAPASTFGRGTQYRRKYENPEWSFEAPTDDERFEAWSNVVEARTRHEQKIASAYSSYVLTLRSLKSGIIQQVDEALKLGAITPKNSSMLPNVAPGKLGSFVVDSDAFKLLLTASPSKGGITIRPLSSSTPHLGSSFPVVTAMSENNGKRGGSGGFGLVLPVLLLGGAAWYFSHRGR